NEDDGDDDDGGSGIWLIAHAVTCEEVCRCSERPGPDDGRVFDVEVEMDCLFGEEDDNLTTDISEFELSELKVYPNPFREKIHFEFVSPVNVHAVLDIYNIAGQKIVTLFDQPIEGGVLHKVEYIPESEISGIYIYKLNFDDTAQVGRIIYRKIE
ncbi:MAG: T9SS type A sorting domain-containing protein, partial [Bacteroidota bacterium]